MLHPALHREHHPLRRRILPNHVHIDLRIEVPLLLLVVPDIEDSLVQQVVVDRPLFEDRNQQVQALLRYLRPLHGHFHLRPLVRLELHVQLLSRHVVGLLLQRHRRLQAIPLLVQLSQPLQRIARRVPRHLDALLQFCLLAKLLQRQARISALQRYPPHPRLRPNCHRIRYIYLIARSIDLRVGRHDRLVVPLLLQHLLDSLRPGCNLRFVKGCPRRKLRRKLQQRGQPVVLHSINRHPPHVIPRHAGKDQRDRIPLPHSANRDIPVASAGK